MIGIPDDSPEKAVSPNMDSKGHEKPNVLIYAREKAKRYTHHPTGRMETSKNGTKLVDI